MINELVAMHCYPSDHVLQLLTYCLKPPCLVFTYMENGSLEDKLHNDPWSPPLTWAYRAKIALGTAKALCHLHGNNIVHGDIKSSNILLDKYFEPKIGDFGTVAVLYKNQSPETHVTLDSIAGTRYYLPEEYLQGIFKKQVRRPVDVFSFGIVLFEMISGKRPNEIVDSMKETTLRRFVDTMYNNLPGTLVLPDGFIADVDKDGTSPFKIIRPTGIVDTNWPHFLYQIASLCTNKEYGHRPAMEAVFNEINCVYESHELNKNEDGEVSQKSVDMKECPSVTITSSSLSFPINFRN